MLALVRNIISTVCYDLIHLILILTDRQDMEYNFAEYLYLYILWFAF